MAQVFISYASADRERARRLADAMESKGYSVWWDRQIAPGRTFDEVIEEALNAASCVVVLWSSASVNSNWVKTEAAEAASRKVLVPALIDNVKIPIEFRRVQAADLTRWEGKLDDPEFQRFLHAVDLEIQENETPQKAPPQSARSMGAGSGTAAAMAPGPETISVQNAPAKPTATFSQPASAPANREPHVDSKPQSEQPRRARWLPVAVPAAIIMIIIAGLWFYNKASVIADVQTPNVVGMTYENAAAAFANAGIAAIAPERQERPAPSDVPGTVLAQIPAAGTTLDQTTRVVLTVAVPAEPVATLAPSVAVDEPKADAPAVEPQVTLPDLKGQTSENAIALLSSAGLNLGVTTEVANNEVSLGTVIAQDPQPAQTLAKNSLVNITVAARRKVPELVGLDLQKAQAELTRLGLTDRIERVRASRGETDNHVVKQSPAPGLDIEKGGEAQLTIAIVTPKILSGGEGLFRTDGKRCVQVCKDHGLKWTTRWSGTANTCTCEF